MSTSRRFEVQKKKLAVRRLSQGSRPNFTSPHGDGRFKFKAKLSPEEYAEKKRKLQQKLGTLKANSNPRVWVKGDLRNKLAVKDRRNEEAQDIAPREGDAQLETKKPFNIQSNLRATAPPKPLLSEDEVSAARGMTFNPFAAALQSDNVAAAQILSKPAYQKLSSSKEGLYRTESTAEDTGQLKIKEENALLPAAKIHDKESFTVTSTHNNPFLITKKDNVSPSLIIEPISKQPALIPSAPSFAAPQAPSLEKNPFASALQAFSKKENVKTDIFGGSKAGDSFEDDKNIKNVSSIADAAKANTTSVFSQGASLIPELTSLKLMGIPEELNNKEFLRSFYTKFGNVKRVYTHPFTKSAIITFLKHDAAAYAKAHGTLLKEGGQPISIFWCKTKMSKSNLGDDDQSMPETSGFEALSKTDDEKVTSKGSLTARKDAFVSMITNYANSLKNTAARDSNGKAEMLEKIDQKLREGMRKETDIQKASLVVGTCPDMCPEKERYLREHRQRLALYEIQATTDAPDVMSGQYPLADPLKTIKEYSRSSADQEEPLAHELRPGSVLQLTMNYLMLNVMDAGDKNWADWYDFVWNRTRGIRKDITQQHLCDESSVDLIEKCARFHIICSHHLCEEDINVFDPKINNENLTKCLQSLKHMYEDLYIHKGVTCPNEAEFRCYQILLNLNNGDILREVTEFHHEVRESQEVKFALEVFRALNSTNYVRFFRLLNAGSYLMGCIMQSYFNQIRARGLLIMNKAYTTINKPSPVPLTDIARLFAIDEIDEASEFCEHYGFQLDDGLVYFSKSSYEEPDSSFPPVRNGFIERKRTCCFGEVVNGKPLPSNVEYVPTNSFDKNGIYNGTYHELALAGLRRSSEKTVEGNKEAAERPVPSPMKVTKDDVKAMCSALLVPIVNQEVFNVSSETMEEVKEAVYAANEATQDIINKTVREELKSSIEHEIEVKMLTESVYSDIFRNVAGKQIKDVVKEEIESEKRKVEHDQRMRIFHIATVVSQDFLMESVIKNLKGIAFEAIRLERQEEVMKMISKESAELSRQLLDEFVMEETGNVCRQSLQFEVELRNMKLERIKQKILTLRTRRLFKRWVQETQTRKHIRETLNNFPACSPLQISSDVIRSLTGHPAHASNLPDCVTLKNDVELAISSISNLARKRNRHRDAIEKIHQQLVSDRREVTRPLSSSPILDYMSRSLISRNRHYLFSKLLVCVPEASGSSSGIDAETLEGKFRMNIETELDKQCSVPHIKDLCLISDKTQRGNISFCMKGLSGSFKNEEKAITGSRELFGITGIIFILDFNEPQIWTIQRTRLGNILSLRPSLPPCPLLLIGIDCPASYEEDQLISKLKLDFLKDEREISDYEFLLIDSDVDGARLNEELTARLITLVSKTPEFPKLQTSELVNLLENAIRVHFYENVYKDRIKRKNADMPTMDARSVADLYNSVLDHVCTTCTCKELMEFSWPSREILVEEMKNTPDLFWNDESTFLEFRSLLNSFKLPSLHDAVDSDGDWHEQQQLCLKYLYSIINSTKLNIHPSELISRIERVINQYLNKWKYRATATDFPWSLVLEECINVMLTSIHKHHSGLKTSRIVCYFEEDFYRFKLPISWIEEIKYANKSILSYSALSGSHLVNTSSRDDYIQRSIVDVDHNLSLIEESLTVSKDHLDLTGSQLQLDELLRKQKLLDESLSAERLASSRFSNTDLNCMEDSSAASTPRVLGNKRKRMIENLVETNAKREIASNQSDALEGISVGLKRPKTKFLESKIDDLLAEVEFMRSKFKFDQHRYHDVVNS